MDVAAQSSPQQQPQHSQLRQTLALRRAAADRARATLQAVRAAQDAGQEAARRVATREAAPSPPSPPSPSSPSPAWAREAAAAAFHDALPKLTLAELRRLGKRLRVPKAQITAACAGCTPRSELIRALLPRLVERIHLEHVAVELRPLSMEELRQRATDEDLDTCPWMLARLNEAGTDLVDPRTATAAVVLAAVARKLVVAIRTPSPRCSRLAQRDDGGGGAALASASPRASRPQPQQPPAPLTLLPLSPLVGCAEHAYPETRARGGSSPCDRPDSPQPGTDADPLAAAATAAKSKAASCTSPCGLPEPMQHAATAPARRQPMVPNQ